MTDVLPLHRDFTMSRQKIYVTAVLTNDNTLHKSIKASLYYYKHCNVRINDTTGQRFFFSWSLKILFREKKIFSNFSLVI